MDSPLVSPQVLADWIASGRRDLRVVDVRWYLGRPAGAGRAAYESGHVPGAVHLDVDGELTASSGPGRHPLPDPRAFVGTLEAAGINDGDTVVAYDDVGGWVAARLWWMLEDLGFGAGGHGGVLVLDGGWPAWTTSGGAVAISTPILTQTPNPTPNRGSVHLAASWRRVIDREALKARLGGVLLLDSRAAARYRGEIEPIDPVPGHIPTALNAPTDGNLELSGRFRDPAELAGLYRSLRRRAIGAGYDLRRGGGAAVVVSCGSGISACHSALAMRIAGLPDPVLYPGSYSDWSTAGEPVAVGSGPGAPPAAPGMHPAHGARQ
ncbi:MAG: sulfurtransferase [Chloroflexi bacterium]|nr:sulfurtransferase [Chloroflexota bacterium]